MNTENSFFSSQRFMAYFAKTCRENLKKYGMSLISMFGILCAFTILIEFISLKAGNMVSFLDVELIFFIISLFFFGAFAAASMFSILKKKTGRIANLMSPASQFEKYLTVWIIAVPIFLIAFVVCAIGADLLRCLLCLILAPDIHSLHITVFSANLSSSFLDDAKLILSFAYFSLQSTYVLGAIVWPKNSFLKTTLFLFIMQTIDMIVMVLCVTAFGSYLHGTALTVADNFPTWLLWTNQLAVCLVCYVLAYFRYRELDLINQW